MISRPLIAMLIRKEWWLTLGTIFKNPIESVPQEVSACKEKDTFTNDDLILCDTPHNRSLYIIGSMRDERVNWILIDRGSSTNIITIRITKELGFPWTNSRKDTWWFKESTMGGKRATCSIKLEITIGDIKSSAWFACDQYKDFVQCLP